MGSKHLALGIAAKTLDNSVEEDITAVIAEFGFDGVVDARPGTSERGGFPDLGNRPDADHAGTVVGNDRSMGDGSHGEHIGSDRWFEQAALRLK